VRHARVFAGIHWRFDVAAGEALGYEVGNYVFSHCLRPASESEDEGDDGDAAVASSHADPAAAVVTPPSRVPSGTRAGVTPVRRAGLGLAPGAETLVPPGTRAGVIPAFAPPAAPAGTVSPAAPTPRPAAPVPANDTGSPPPGVPSSVASSKAAADPVLPRARKPAGAGALADGLVEDLPSEDSLGASVVAGGS
jgi:hypothetical protein